jgi:hypothetical protein
MGQEHEQVVGLEADHRQICKFDKIGNNNYRRVLGRLENTLTRIQEDTPLQLPSVVTTEPGVYDQDGKGGLQERLNALKNGAT